MLGLLVIGALIGSCAGPAKFIPLEEHKIRLMPMDSLRTPTSFRASGKVLAMKGEVRYLARWAFAANTGRMRIQVFATEGTMLADMAIQGDSLCVVLAQERECHCGSVSAVPLGALLGLEIDWGEALIGLNTLLWPNLDSSYQWMPGRLGRREGWFDPRRRVFLAVDEKKKAPKYLCLGEARDRVTAQIESYREIHGIFFPSRVVFHWPGKDSRMWLDINTRKIGDIAEDVFCVPCKEMSDVIAW